MMLPWDSPSPSNVCKVFDSGTLGLDLGWRAMPEGSGAGCFPGLLCQVLDEEPAKETADPFRDDNKKGKNNSNSRSLRDDNKKARRTAGIADLVLAFDEVLSQGLKGVGGWAEWFECGE